MSFARAVAFVLAQEGGYVCDPADPGGATNMGIALNRHPELTLEDIRSMTVERATEIYQAQYAEAIHFASWPDPIGFVLLDAAVNMGPAAAIQCLQLAVRAAADGIVGPTTITAVQGADVKQLVARFTAQRIKRYSRMLDWLRYADGWLTRSTLAAMEALPT